MASNDRPLSPHIFIYRWQLSAVLSGLHRLTGIALTAGTLLLAWWLIAAAAGPESFAVAQGFIASIVGRLMFFGWSFALFYHLCNGIRHLAWDAGWGFELATVHRSGWAVVAVSIALTVLSWTAGYAARGSFNW